MKITKHRDGELWRIRIDGRPTALTIEKGPAPKYRSPQTYDVCLGADDCWLFEAKSVGAAMAVITTIREA